MNSTKQNFAKFALYSNGFLGLFTWLAFPYFPFMIFGYFLLWAYWLEARVTNQASVWRWLASLVSNLGLMLVYGYFYQARFDGEPIVVLAFFWAMLMSVGSVFSTVAVLRLPRKVTS